MTKEQQLLKEAAGQLKAWATGTDGVRNWIECRKASTDLAIRINELLSQPHPEPVTALSWEQALDKESTLLGYRSYADLIDSMYKWSDFEAMAKKAAHLFMEANRQQNPKQR